MSSLTFLVLWTAALGANDSESYAEAHQQAMKNGQPIVVMVSTEWCAPCQVMKKSIIPQVRQHGLLRRVVFAVVNPDHERDLAVQLTGGGPVPQLVMFRKTPTGWMRRKLIGGQSVETVEEFINQGVAQSEAETKAAAAKQSSEDAKKPATAAAQPADKGRQTTRQPAQGTEQSSGTTPIVPVSHSGGER